MTYTSKELIYLIEKSKIENVYLFNGPEVGEKNKIIEIIKKRLFPDEDPLIYTYYCDENIDNVEFLDNLQSQMLFSTKKLVILKGVDNISKETIEAIDKFLFPYKIKQEIFEKEVIQKLKENEKKIILSFYSLDKDVYKIESKIKDKDKNNLMKIFYSCGYFQHKDTYLILINDTNERVPDEINSLLMPNQIIMFWEMFENQKVEWIKEYLKSRGIFITDDAVKFILDMIPNNTEQLQYELDKIIALFQEKYKGKKYIELSFIEDYLEFSKDENVFTLYGAIITGDIDKAIMILNYLFNSDEESLLNGLVWCHRRFLKILDLYVNHQLSLDEIFTRLKIFSKKNQEEIKKGIKRYDFYYICMLFYQLLELDYYLKVLPEQLRIIKLEQFVINFVNKRLISDILAGDFQFIES